MAASPNELMFIYSVPLFSKKPAVHPWLKESITRHEMSAVVIRIRCSVRPWCNARQGYDGVRCLLWYLVVGCWVILWVAEAVSVQLSLTSLFFILTLRLPFVSVFSTSIFVRAPLAISLSLYPLRQSGVCVSLFYFISSLPDISLNIFSLIFS